MLFGIRKNVLRKTDALALNTALAFIELAEARRLMWTDAEIKYESMSGSYGSVQNVSIRGHVTDYLTQRFSNPVTSKIVLECISGKPARIFRSGVHTIEISKREGSLIGKWDSPTHYAIRSSDAPPAEGHWWTHSVHPQV